LRAAELAQRQHLGEVQQRPGEAGDRNPVAFRAIVGVELPDAVRCDAARAAPRPAGDGDVDG
jgi:hypothetical protein